jgi:hypothetical protein
MIWVVDVSEEKLIQLNHLRINPQAKNVQAS